MIGMETEIGSTVEQLTADLSRRWLVTTQGSTHIWDMNSRTYMRIPGEASRVGSFDYDGTAHRITRVDRYPKVGSFSVVWFDDPLDPTWMEQFRQSSEITRIERIS
jgi:hypothetical protein